MNIAQALACADTLASDSPKRDAELLLCHVLQKNTSHLLAWPDLLLTPEQCCQYNALLERRRAGEPIAYLLGHQPFWTLNLQVSPATLIPRADTERLVEAALALPLAATARIADLGTGTGAIALALASERPGWEIWASDAVADAVALARSNARQHQLHNVHCIQSNWLDALPGQFDLIVSNPPYINPQDSHLEQGDLRFEPRSALVAEDAGLADIRTIASTARQRLNPDGWLQFEHGYQQAEPVQQLLAQLGYRQITTYQDYGGNDRVTEGQWHHA